MAENLAQENDVQLPNSITAAEAKILVAVLNAAQFNGIIENWKETRAAIDWLNGFKEYIAAQLGAETDGTGN